MQTTIITILVWNLLGAGYEPPGGQYARWPDRMPGVVYHIKQRSPDIVLLQECKRHMMYDIINAIPEYKYNVNCYDMNAVLSKSPIGDSACEFINLDQNQIPITPHNCAMAHSMGLNFYSCHVSLFPYYPEELRFNQGFEILSLVEAPCVFGGDFNLTMNNPPIIEMHQEYRSCSDPTEGPPLGIDYIFTSQYCGRGWIRQMTPYSDHPYLYGAVRKQIGNIGAVLPLLLN